LKDHGIRVFVDKDLEHTPGWKYYYWEMMGVPTRLEIGRQEASNSTVTIARRDGKPKTTVGIDELVPMLEAIWREVGESLRIRGLKHLEKMVRKTQLEGERLEEFKGLLIMPWDGSKECSDKLEEATGKQLLGEIVESPIQLGDPSKYESCNGGKADRWALLGVTY
ncbi:MAG: His/Gly/Thr/Pro-type tRNA ligase C-terminal domain-containing protein, partial [Thermosphaera sp.]